MHDRSSGPGVTVVATVRNEESTIGPFLTALLSQSLQPDEIVIVDGGSTDATVPRIRETAGKRPSVRLIVAPGVNIPKGRNLAIAAARTALIAATDAGCRTDVDWLRNIVGLLQERQDLDVVGGVYLPEGTLFQRCVGAILTPDIKRLDPSTFLPSSRSIAFRKSAWAAVGGYPERLDMAEDTYFDLALRERGFRFGLARDAIVYWNARDGVVPLFRQMYRYAYWNVRAGVTLASERKKIVLYALTILLLGASMVVPVMAVVPAAGFALYLMRYSIRAFRHVRDGRVFVLVPFITMVKEAGSLIGYLGGVLAYMFRRAAP